MSVQPAPYEEPSDDEPSIFDIVDPEHDARVEAEADADIAAGRLIPFEDIAQWLKTWGTPDYHEPPAAWFE